MALPMHDHTPTPDDEFDDTGIPIMHLGQRIVVARDNRGLTQDQLAALIGRTRQTLSTWENTGCVPRTVDFDRLTAALGVPAAWLRGELPTQSRCFAVVSGDGGQGVLFDPDDPDAPPAGWNARGQLAVVR